MHLTTPLPLATLFFKHWHIDDTEVGVIVAKASCVVHPDGQILPLQKPDPIAFEDMYAGDPESSPLVTDQELAPGKLGTDITLNAVAHAQGGQAVTDWPVRVAIANKLSYQFQVFGPWGWQQSGGRWAKTGVQPATEIPIAYTHAYGGHAPKEDGDICDFNPVGTGFATDQMLKDLTEIKGPQNAELAEVMAATRPQEMTVHGFGPIAKTWLPRRATAGTFDDTWKATRHPRMPKDYSLQFWNAAPLPLQVKPFLDGDELVQADGLHPSGRPLLFQLPRIGVYAALSGDETRQVRMVLDTVAITAIDLEDIKCTLIWRVVVKDPDAYATASIESYRLEPRP